MKIKNNNIVNLVTKINLLSLSISSMFEFC